MTWFFPAFFGIVVLCAAIYLFRKLRDQLAPQREYVAVVEKRYMENFPMTMGFVKRDRQERHLTFRAEEGAPLDFTVSEEIYKLCPMGTKGVLVHQGARFVKFDITELPHQNENTF